MNRKSQSTGDLSAREQQIAQVYAQGESYQQIADRLCLAPSTVRTHLATIYRKLRVSSKLELRDALPSAATPQADLVEGFPERPEKPSIAVLAFENMSGDPEQEYFSDGISDDIITALSRSPWLFIIARNTTFTYKGSNVDVRRVAEELGVRFVLEGSVRRSGDRVRVTAQLIDGLTGGHVWSDRYDGQLEDVFDLQDEITRNVVASIQTTVHLSTIQDPVERASHPDLTVWELTMRSWHLLYDFDPESYAHAKTLLERALAIDPESAEANMVLSLINHHIAIMGFAKDEVPAMETAYALGRRATQLDDRNEYAHWAFGISCWGLLKYDESLAALERAVALNPNCSLAYGSLGTLLGILGCSEEAIANQEIAIRSNPLDPSIFFRFSGLALAHYMAGRYVIAIEWAERAIHRMPRWYFAHFVLAASHVALDQHEQASATAEACVAVIPNIRIRDLDRVPLKDTKKMDKLRNRLRIAGFSD
ncbi:LuxR C-terminal-related transcriptional regulator [Pseudohalocynthiibacter aestuariivivens]|jgi:TolB-like protein/DNA-binding CsgD family transcriptional regulator/Tfp pilus assembly protein PilF|uniref:LuxR C-terminal-related transcriptional regulator n=1 Tax=Pseudohalocynthiibacter aestuariivivens TaxID=1591409 RepID=A0ABV5J9R0_9RHOB|nr:MULTISPECIES: LuxR C-terminal-related transcriptional regulator [Pseudohalocynthiibacter]MBS9719043.1 transcriptional regulator [Pseudohalocynthiibacter aestuariivivens]MCK0104625.1 LuxR C-terminal-related transcriptional regulator [Pseudohalocynthiibacter sp. F2068]